MTKKSHYNTTSNSKPSKNPYHKYKRPKIVVSQAERERKERYNQNRESLIRLALERSARSRQYLEGLSLEELEFAAQYGNHLALDKPEYVDDRNFIESDKKVHNGTEVMPSKKFRVYRDMKVANHIGGYRMKKRTLYALSENDPKENKKEQIAKILKKLPEEYRLVIDRIIDLDLAQLAELCLNKYAPTIRKYLGPLVEFRANEIDIFFPRNQIVEDLMIERSGFMAFKYELKEFGMMQENNEPRDAIISRAHTFLFDFRNNFSGADVDDATMSRMQLDIELVYDKYQPYFDRLVNNKAAILVIAVIKRYYSSIQEEELAIELFGEDNASSFTRTFNSLAEKLPKMLSVEFDDDYELENDYEFDDNYEVEHRPIFEVLDEHILCFVTVNVMNNEKLVLGMPGELVRSHLYSSEEDSTWYTTHESTWVFGSARQVRNQPLRIKSLMEVFKNRRIKVIKGPETLEGLEDLLTSDYETTAIVDDIRPIAADNVSSAYLEMDIEDVLRAELVSIIEKDQQRIATTSDPVESSILKKHAANRYKEQLATFRQKFVNDTTRLHELRGGGESVTRHEYFELIEMYHPALNTEIKQVLDDLISHPDFRVGAELSGAWHYDQKCTGKIVCNPNWAHPGEIILDNIIMDGFEDKMYAYSNPKNLDRIIEMEVK